MQLRCVHIDHPFPAAQLRAYCASHDGTKDVEAPLIRPLDGMAGE